MTLSISLEEAKDWSERYLFQEILAQGGMGIIYLAEDKARENAHCVVKQLIVKPANKSEHDESARLFRREAEVLKFLNHPGIVRFIDSHSTNDGHYFLVMDYIKGKNLDELVKKNGPFSCQAVVEIAIQCCEVLEYLHHLNPPIIYRDLKPSNIMLTKEQDIVLIDFGIARALMPEGIAATRVITTGYSPPEQYYGKPELRSDLYALGATLYHLLTGHKPRPLTTTSPSKVIQNILPSLDNLIIRLTAQSAVERPISAQYVRYELYHIYHELDPNFVVPEEARLFDWKKQSENTDKHGVQSMFKKIMDKISTLFDRL